MNIVLYILIGLVTSIIVGNFLYYVFNDINFYTRIFEKEEKDLSLSEEQLLICILSIPFWPIALGAVLVFTILIYLSAFFKCKKNKITALIIWPTKTLRKHFLKHQSSKKRRKKTKLV